MRTQTFVPVIAGICYGLSLYTGIKTAETEPQVHGILKNVKKYAAPLTLFGCGLVLSLLEGNEAGNSISAYRTAYDILYKNTNLLKKVIPDKILEDAESSVGKKRVEQNIIPQNMFVLGPSQLYAIDSITGQFFITTIDLIKRAEFELNRTIFTDGYATVSDYQYSMSIASSKDSTLIGWTETVVFSLTAVLKDSTIPCIYIDLPSPIKI